MEGGGRISGRGVRDLLMMLGRREGRIEKERD